jgi:hypothetical protein
LPHQLPQSLFCFFEISHPKEESWLLEAPAAGPSPPG